MVNETLCSRSFDPTEAFDMKWLSYNTALVLALTSRKASGSSLCFICPSILFLVLCELLSFASEVQKRLHSLCTVHTLCSYINLTGRSSMWPVVCCFANQAMAKTLSEQWLYHWIGEVIFLAYSSRGLCPSV